MLLRIRAVAKVHGIKDGLVCCCALAIRSTRCTVHGLGWTACDSLSVRLAWMWCTQGRMHAQMSFGTS